MGLAEAARPHAALVLAGAGCAMQQAGRKTRAFLQQLCLSIDAGKEIKNKNKVLSKTHCRLKTLKLEGSSGARAASSVSHSMPNHSRSR